jgi:phage terminase large subunit-like protein
VRRALESAAGRAEERDEARYDWYGRHARPAQTPPPGDWRTWLVLAGRSFGKTRCGVEWVRHQVETGRCRRMAVVAPTAADARDVLVEGESGLLAVCPPWCFPTYEPSKRRLTWPNGAIVTTYSADEPERLRGPQHDGGLLDEFAAWRYPAAYDMYVLGNRLRDTMGGGPRTCITTTPRPVPHLLKLLERANPEKTPDPAVVVTGGSTFDNAANVAAEFLEEIRSSYAGSRLERQEIFAEILRDTPGALWDIDLLESCHLFTDPAGVALARVVVAIDPAATSAEGSSETGIVVAARGTDGRGYVLEDASLRGSPEQWARAAVAAFDAWQADLVVGEVNNGGEMIEAVLRTVRRSIPYKAVRASRGKQTRAEPIAALYRQGKVSHMGVFALLESQMCSWVPGMTSPDRMDALVWAFSELLVPGDSGHGPVFMGGARAPLRPGRMGR